MSKSGGRNNASAWIGYAPEPRVGVAVVTNCGDPSVAPIGYWLLERCVVGGNQPVTKYGYGKVAQYKGVRWESDRPLVCVRGRWSRLVSIDGVPIDRILECAQKEYGSKARKRLGEDVVELLATMGHAPGWEVTLGLEDEAGGVEEMSIRMTEANRESVREQSAEN